MVLAYTVICFDNSEFTRNGDFSPNRLMAQYDAANLIVGCKLGTNIQNGVGIVSMANRPTVVSSIINDSGKLYMKLYDIKLMDRCNFLSSIRVAGMILKHAPSSNATLRIVIFIASPMDQVGELELMNMARSLSKAKIDADVVCIGEYDSKNRAKMTSFIGTLNENGNKSHMIDVPRDCNMVEFLLNTPVCADEVGQIPSGSPALFDFGVDPNQDPELAYALRISVDENQLREVLQLPPENSEPTPTLWEWPTNANITLPDIDLARFETMDDEELMEWTLNISSFLEELRHRLEDGTQSDVTQEDSEEISVLTDDDITAMDLSISDMTLDCDDDIMNSFSDTSISDITLDYDDETDFDDDDTDSDFSSDSSVIENDQ